MAVLSKFTIKSAIPYGFIVFGSFIIKPISVLVSLPLCLLLFIARTVANRPVPALRPGKDIKVSLQEKTIVNHNVALYRFKLPSAKHVLGLPVGNHISIKGKIAGKEIWRSYTPVTSDADLGHFTLLVKSYPDGNVSKWISNMRIGDEMDIRGPKGNFTYRTGIATHIGMIAGGTGITPMLQIIRAIVEEPRDETKISLIYANVAFEDILLKEELDALACRYEQFKVHYVLNIPPTGWTGGEGFVTKETVESFLPCASADVRILICGPPPMVSAMKKVTASLGFQHARAVSRLEDQVFCF